MNPSAILGSLASLSLGDFFRRRWSQAKQPPHRKVKVRLKSRMKSSDWRRKRERRREMQIRSRRINRRSS